MWIGRALLLFFGLLAGCGAPVADRSPPPGELVAFGGGQGGARDACFLCHGRRGEGTESAPMLAGQNAGYMLKQLEDYAHETRMHDAMNLIAMRMTADERISVAEYYAGLDPILVTQPDAGVAPAIYANRDDARGLQACADCHGARGEGVGLADPRIAGLSQPYIQQQLLAWKASKRRNDPRDEMGRIARALSDEEISALSVYIAALQP